MIKKLKLSLRQNQRPLRESVAKSKSPSAPDAPKTESSEKTADPSSGYSRGEGQKPVSQAYKDNWNAIYGKKKKKKR